MVSAHYFFSVRQCFLKGFKSKKIRSGIALAEAKPQKIPGTQKKRIDPIKVPIEGYPYDELFVIGVPKGWFLFFVH